MEKESPSTSLLSQWKNREKKVVAPTIEKMPEGEVVPLSSGQQRLWFLQRLLPDNPVYNYSESLIFEGALNADALEQSLEVVFRTNSILRSSYHFENGKTVQRINEEPKINLNRFDLSQLSSFEREREKFDILLSDAKHQFDLATFPLVRVSLIKLSASQHIFLLTMHHIVFDKWSMDLFLDQLATHYRCIVSGEAVKEEENDRLQFADYAYWLESKEVDASQLDYWVGKLGGDIPLLDLPTDFPAPVRPTYRGTSNTAQFSTELSAKILDLAKRLETTPYVLLLSAYYLLLHRYSGQEDILVGSPISLRGDKALENIIGFFDETIVLRTSISPTMSFLDLAGQVRNTTLEAFSNKDVPFDLLVKKLNPKRSLNVNPFFRAMFIYHAVTEIPTFGPGLSLSHSFFNPGVSKFDLTLYISNDNGLLSSVFEYTTDIFKESTIVQFQEHLKLLLEGVTADPEKEVSSFDMLTSKEREFFFPTTPANDGSYQKYKGIHEIIASCAENSPDAIAAVFQDGKIKYGELLQKADSISHRILEITQGKNAIVGLCIDRSLEMIIGMLAILRAGCAYMPIDPDYPSQRIHFMLEDSEVKLVLSRNTLKSVFNEYNGRLITIDEEHLQIPADHIELPSAKVDNLAYVIYTSGSTGNPKGVPITHKNIISSTEGRLSFYEKDPTVFLLMSSIAFDSSKAGIFWTLCTGGTLIIGEKRIEQDIDKLCVLIATNGVTHTLMLPSLYKLVLEFGDISKLQSLDTAIVAGETCPTSLGDLHFEKLPGAKLYNEYGPTEATVWCTAYQIEKNQTGETIPIGRPVANANILLLNGLLKPVPFGAVGEIYIGGPGLSGGYINRPDLTKKAFVQNPYAAFGTEFLYRTGDKGRFNDQGDLEFLGRSDQQVKIRGFRIELDEIEQAVAKNDMVREAVVLVAEEEASQSLRPDTAGSKHLVAYVRANGSYDPAVLKRELRQEIPDYMVPAAFVAVDEFPRLPNGKINKKTLLALKNTRVEGNILTSTPPENETQGKLVAIWEEILNFSPVGIHDNFFEIGGDSILSIQFIAKAREKGMALSPNQLFDYQTIAELEDFITSNISSNGEQKDKWDYLVAFRKQGTKKPLFCIHAGGGHVFFYSGLADYLDKDRPVYGIQASGLYGNQPMHQSIEEMASAYINAMKSVQATGPYNVLVYCISATVGHEISHQMQALGMECNLIVMDTLAKPWVFNTPGRLKMRIKGFWKRFTSRPLYTVKMMLSERLKYIRPLFYRLFGMDDEKTLEALRINLIKISTAYEWKPISNEVVLILTDKPHESINKEIIESWGEYAQGGAKILRTKGNHVFLFEEDNLPHVAEIIEQGILDGERSSAE